MAKFAGRVAEPILGREAKLATLIELRERLGLRRTKRSRPATAPTISR